MALTTRLRLSAHDEARPRRPLGVDLLALHGPRGAPRPVPGGTMSNPSDFIEAAENEMLLLWTDLSAAMNRAPIRFEK